MQTNKNFFGYTAFIVSSTVYRKIKTTKTKGTIILSKATQASLC